MKRTNYKHVVAILEEYNKSFIIKNKELKFKKEGDLTNQGFQTLAMTLKELAVLFNILDLKLTQYDAIDTKSQKIMATKKASIYLEKEEKDTINKFFYLHDEIAILIKALYEWLYHLQEAIYQSNITEFKNLWEKHQEEIIPIRESRNKLVTHYAGNLIPQVYEVGFTNDGLPFITMYPSAFSYKEVEDYLSQEKKAFEAFNEILCEIGISFDRYSIKDILQRFINEYSDSPQVLAWIRKYGGYLKMDQSVIAPFIPLLDDLMKL